jgi:hypothetical protein
MQDWSSAISRRRALGAFAGVVAALRAVPARASDVAKFVTRVELGSAKPFAGDRAGFLTVSPGAASGRTKAILRLGIGRAAHVQIDIVNRNAPGAHALPAEGGSAGAAASSTRLMARMLGRGLHEIAWQPGSETVTGTYSLVTTLTDRAGRRTVLGAASPAHPKLPAAPVVRVLGIDAAFTKRSHAHGETGTLVVSADARTLTLDLLLVGPENVPTYANDRVDGVAVAPQTTIDWSANVDGPAAIPVPIGDWPSGVYFARLTADDGRMGFAPLILRPAAPATRVAICMPTNTWQAYNFQDANGDGFGDSWYVSLATHTIDLLRPHLHRGVPYRFRSYDLSFLRWLAQTQKRPDFYSDEDIGAFPSGTELRAAYDFVVFPGHSEYVTEHAYDVVEQFRDLGGNLAFLSSDNFFRRVDQSGDKLKLVGLWRDLGRPEAALLGTQYRASDRGKHQSPFVVSPAGAASFAFAGTNLTAGSTFGRYGIEVDATARSTPPGTQVLAEIPNALGPGLTAQMTYYETPAGARVFSAGVLNFGGQVLLWPEATKLLENVWARLTEPR